MELLLRQHGLVGTLVLGLGAEGLVAADGARSAAGQVRCQGQSVRHQLCFCVDAADQADAMRLGACQCFCVSGVG